MVFYIDEFNFPHFYINMKIDDFVGKFYHVIKKINNQSNSYGSPIGSKGPTHAW